MPLLPHHIRIKILFVARRIDGAMLEIQFAMNSSEAVLYEISTLGLWLINDDLDVSMVLHVLRLPFNGLSFHKSFFM